MAGVEVTRTYLEMRSPGALRAAASTDPAADVRRETCSAALYRSLYGTVGRAYNWYERNDWTDDELTRHLAQPHVAVWILYFGLAPSYVGRGLGKYLLTRAVEEAWKFGAARVWLHTCTQDHPSALPNYLARGFTPFRTETYVAPDPTPLAGA